MKVRVMAFGLLREMAGIDQPGRPLDIELPEGATVSDVLDRLGLPEGLVYSILVDGVRAEPAASLDDGTELTLMPAFTGGR
jgi:molybdopterin converting factor small subunit